MTARDVEGAADKVKMRECRAREAALSAVVIMLLALPAISLSVRLATALCVASLAALIVAAIFALDRRELISRLALDRRAYVIPEVERYGRRVSLRSERERLAAWLGEVLVFAPDPNTLYIDERVDAYRHEIESLARELVEPDALVEPQSAVACKRLLNRSVESPLYNWELPAENLGAALFRIRAGIKSTQRRD